MEGGSFSECGSRQSPARARLANLQKFQKIAQWRPQELYSGTVYDCKGAVVTLVRGAEDQE
eukprot:1316606-Pyramimonas_sp.AAC.1